MNKLTLAMALFSASTTVAMAASNNTITFQGKLQHKPALLQSMALMQTQWYCCQLYPAAI